VSSPAVQHERGPRKPKLGKDAFLAAHHSSAASSFFSSFSSATSSGSKAGGQLLLPGQQSLFSPLAAFPRSSLAALDRNRPIWPKFAEMGRTTAAAFTLPPPPPPLFTTSLAASHPFPASWENLQESAARLLFMAVRWAKCLAPFQNLPQADQVPTTSFVNTTT
jgi:hypothetical protein